MSDFLETLQGQNLLYPFLDSISHAFESLWNKNRNNESVKYAIDSLNLNLTSLKAFCSKDEMYDFEKMILASNFAGKAINITRTSIAHSISYPLTTKYGIPHGLACSFTIPRIFKYVKNDEIEFIDTFRFSIGTFLAPIYYCLLSYLFYSFFGWKIGLSYLIISIIIALAYVKFSATTTL